MDYGGHKRRGCKAEGPRCLRFVQCIAQLGLVKGLTQSCSIFGCTLGWGTDPCRSLHQWTPSAFQPLLLLWLCPPKILHEHLRILCWTAIEELCHWLDRVTKRKHLVTELERHIVR